MVKRKVKKEKGKVERNLKGKGEKGKVERNLNGKWEKKEDSLKSLNAPSTRPQTFGRHRRFVGCRVAPCVLHRHQILAVSAFSRPEKVASSIGSRWRIQRFGPTSASSSVQ
jgi:hypothetical protein